MNETVGILGGGQLGCMLAESVVRLGALPLLFDPKDDAPSQRDYETIRASFDDVAALTDFASRSAVITYEREHLNRAALERVPRLTEKLIPSLEVLAIAADRVREKTAFLEAGAPPVLHWVAHGTGELRGLGPRIAGAPVVAKLATGGYDGKGQWTLRSGDDLLQLASDERLANETFVVERRVDLVREASVIVGRSRRGEVYVFPTFENRHTNHVLDLTFFPATFPGSDELPQLAIELAERLSLVGLLTVEFFLARDEGTVKIYANEIAPRPHNSGHVTRSSSALSQFDLLAHLLLDRPIDTTGWEQNGAAHVVPTRSNGVYCMANLLGDLWLDAKPETPSAGPEPLEVVLYGKRPVRGRKLGHLTVRGDDHAAAESAALAARERFSRDTGSS